MYRLRLAIIWITGLLLTACGGGGPDSLGIMAADTRHSAQTEQILVATSRARTDDPDFMFNGERAFGLNYAAMTVSVPQNREPGRITYPSQNPDLSRQFATLAANQIASEQVFANALETRLAQQDPDARAVFIFVHGYNVSFAHGVFRHAQIRHDYDVPAIAVSYSWPSAARLPLYLYDRDSMRFAVDGLVKTMETAAASSASGVVLVAHSMGTQLAVEALRELSITGRGDVLDRTEAVVLAAPDIDIDVFDQLFAQIAPLPDPFIVLVSARDAALRASQRIRGGHPRLGDTPDIPALQAKGITVLDLTTLNDGADRTRHSTFATSPTLIQMVRNDNFRLDHLTRETGPSAGDPVGEGLGLISDIAASIIYLPAQAAGVR